MDKTKLVELALEARHFSYCPYSGFAVGAALLCEPWRSERTAPGATASSKNRSQVHSQCQAVPPHHHSAVLLQCAIS